MKRTFTVLALALSLLGCNREQNSYRVIERTNSDAYDGYVSVVLLHDGHKLHAKCNNYKEGTVDDPKKVTHCNLHVGQTIRCKSFLERSKEGYDLICGN